MTTSNKINETITDESSTHENSSRRKFITGTMTGSMVAAGVAVAPGVFLTSTSSFHPTLSDHQILYTHAPCGAIDMQQPFQLDHHQ